MLMPRYAVSITLISLMVLSAEPALGQDYPSKSVRIVAGGVGGVGDITSRIIAQVLSISWAQQVIVDNRGGVFPAEFVSKAPPDGYTLFLTGSAHWLEPLLHKVPYDPVSDFTSITMTSRGPNVLVVHPSLPVKSVKELVSLAKAKPGALNYGAASVGSSTHLAAELFNSIAGINIVRIPYKAAGLAVSDLIGGQVQLMFATLASVTPHVKSGRLRALAVTTSEPSALLPGLPTVAASGMPGYEMASPLAMFAPAKTPVTLINRLNQEIVRVLNQADVKEKLFNAGQEIVGSSPEQLTAAVKSDIARISKLITDVGIKAE